MTGTIVQLHRASGTGSVLGEDGKTYLFRRSDLRGVWFHDLTEGATVRFEVGKKIGAFEGTDVRLVRPSQ